MIKKTILTLTFTCMLLAVTCNTFAQENKQAAKARKHVNEAQKDVVDAKHELNEARIDSTEEYRAFRREAEMEIKNNDGKIALLKAKKVNGTEQENAKYQRKVKTLEMKNDDLRKKINGSDSIKMDTWSTFKREFNHDMKQLGKAIKNIGVDNSK